MLPFATLIVMSGMALPPLSEMTPSHILGFFYYGNC
jgi:hypothetical protein